MMIEMDPSGFEPETSALQGRRSTVELQALQAKGIVLMIIKKQIEINYISSYKKEIPFLF